MENTTPDPSAESDRHTTYDGLTYGAVLLAGYVTFLARSRKEVRTLLRRG